MIEELKIIASGLVGAVVGGLALWVRASRARVDVSRDTLAVTATASQAKWISGLEQSFEGERKARIASDERSQLFFSELQEAKRCLHESQVARRVDAEHIERLTARNRRLIDIVTETRPELKGWLVTEPAALDDLAPHPVTATGKGPK